MNYEEALDLVRTKLYPLPTEADKFMEHVATLSHVPTEEAIEMVWAMRTKAMAVYLVENPDSDLTNEFLTRFS